MSFFVSDALKDRVTENVLIEDEKSPDTDFLTAIVNFKECTHKFRIESLCSSKNNKAIVFEIPESYAFLSSMLNGDIEIKVNTYDQFLEKMVFKNYSYERVKQNDRNCYFLRIVSKVR